MGKPRMTQRDRWKKRPVVVRYYAYADSMREQAGPVPDEFKDKEPYRIRVISFHQVKKSWSKKKKEALIGKGMRSKPDADNAVKGVMDIMFKEDSSIWDERGIQFWCEPGEERVEVSIWYD